MSVTTAGDPRSPARLVAEAPEASACLIEEAGDRRRRRRKLGAIVAAVVLLGGWGAVVFGGGGSGTQTPAPASPGAVARFVSKAEQAAMGAFAVSYRVQVSAPYRGAQVPPPPARSITADVTAAQLSRGTTVYRQTPSLAFGFPGAAGHSFEVFSIPRGYFSCAQARVSSRWTCYGRYVGIGMGTTWELQGPYIPQALVQGLANAVTEYGGSPTTRRESAYLVPRRITGHLVRCLVFGRPSHPSGSVCLARSGVVYYYDLPQSVSYEDYRTAVLQSYSTRVDPLELQLPAVPHPEG